MRSYLEYDVTVTRTTTVRVRVDATQEGPAGLARDVALAYWRDPGLDNAYTGATHSLRTSDSGTSTTIIDVTDRDDSTREQA